MDPTPPIGVKYELWQNFTGRHKLTMTDFLLNHGSYMAIVVVLILTGSGLPLPEEVPTVVAGALAANGVLHPWLAVICCLFGAVAGDCIMYFIGYAFGRSVLQDHPWWVRFVTPQREAQVEEMFQRHGLKVFFLARFLVLVRSPLLLAAGILRVSFTRFLLIDLFSATMVVGSFFGLSYMYGEAIGRWIRRSEILLTVVVVFAVAGVALFLWRRHVRKMSGSLSAHRLTAPPLSDPPGPPSGKPRQCPLHPGTSAKD
jgi:membrane protein DedA with SNARE-associated domain